MCIFEPGNGTMGGNRPDISQQQRRVTHLRFQSRYQLRSFTCETYFLSIGNENKHFALGG